MLKEQFEKVKSLIVKNDNESNKKKIENLVVFLIILIITLVIVNYIWKDNKKTNNNKYVEESTFKQLAKETSTVSTKTDLEQKLEDILAKIEGVGKVSVLITYSQSSEIVAMYNETSKSSKTEEEDSGRRNKNYK